MAVGNEASMAQIRSLMETEGQVSLGSELTSGTMVDFTTPSGNHFTGAVVFKRPDVSDYMRMGGLKSEIFRKAGVTDLSLVDPPVKLMAHLLATLKVVIVKCPEWLLEIDRVKDPDILFHVFDKYEEWEDSFRKKVQVPSAGDSQATEGAEALATSQVLEQPAAE